MNPYGVLEFKLNLSHALLHLLLMITLQSRSTMTLTYYHSHFADEGVHNAPTGTQLMSSGARSPASSVWHRSLSSQPPHYIHVTSDKRYLPLLQSLIRAAPRAKTAKWLMIYEMRREQVSCK